MTKHVVNLSGGACSTFASLFSGGDLAGEGARMAGFTPIWGVEYDPDIAAVAELDGTKIVVSKVEDVDFSTLATPDWLHMSPPCINASVAKAGAGEAPEDIEMAQGCIRAIRHFKPPYVSLENVWQYRNFESFQLIYAALMELGYQIRFWHLCAADYGVAQTRKRLIMVASLKGTPKRPEQTHSKDGHVGMFETIPKWIGWYEAIEDLIPTLPESQFAEWQLSRLQGSVVIGGELDGGFLMPGGNSSSAEPREPREPREPSMTIGDTERVGNIPRAFIVNETRDLSLRTETEPAAGIVSERGGRERAFIIDGKPANYEGDLRIVDAEDPSPTATATATANQHPMRAWLSQGKVVALTVRALARLQSIPDSYQLPEKNSLGCRIVGNAVPPLLMQRIIEAQMK